MWAAEHLAGAKDAAAEQVQRSEAVFKALVKRQVDEELSGAAAAIRRIRDTLVPQAPGAWAILEKYGMLEDVEFAAGASAPAHARIAAQPGHPPQGG